MANETRVRADFVSGLVEDNPLTNVSTTLTSADLADLPAITSSEHAVLVLDPDGTPEIVYVTAHTASATTATIARGKEGTTAVEHSVDTPWIHGPVESDFNSGLLSTTQYSPSPAEDKTTSSTSGVDLDATNLKISFVAPPSASVLIKLSAVIYGSNLNAWQQWGLYDENAAAEIANSWVGMGATTQQVRVWYTYKVTGLTPGTSYTYRWRHRVSVNTTTMHTQYGPNTNVGPAVMEVWSA